MNRAKSLITFHWASTQMRATINFTMDSLTEHKYVVREPQILSGDHQAEITAYIERNRVPDSLIGTRAEIK